MACPVDRNIITHDSRGTRLNVKAFKLERESALRFLIRLSSKGAARGTFLETIRTLARSVGAEARNPKWTSYGSLELDIFCPSRADFDLLMAAIGPVAKVEFTTELKKASELLADEVITSRARDLFNAERYWECHEILEGLWRQKKGEEKRLLQGIILVCAAFVHHQKGEEDVALGVMERGAKQLDFPRETYGGFDLPILRKNAQRVLIARSFTVFDV